MLPPDSCVGARRAETEPELYGLPPGGGNPTKRRPVTLTDGSTGMAIVAITYVQTYNQAMKTIAAARFKEQCLALLDTLDHEGLVVTKHGRPVAIVRPIARLSADRIGSLRGKIKVRGNLLSTGVTWDAGD